MRVFLTVFFSIALLESACLCFQLSLDLRRLVRCLIYEHNRMPPILLIDINLLGFMGALVASATLRGHLGKFISFFSSGLNWFLARISSANECINVLKRLISGRQDQNGSLSWEESQFPGLGGQDGQASSC